MKKTSKTSETETSLLARVKVRLIEEDELAAWNNLIEKKHYLSSTLVGPQLRYVAEVEGTWVGLLSFGQASYHLRDRESFVGWNDVQRGRRLGMLAQNTRFLLLHERGHLPNLASKILSLSSRRVSNDWQQRYGSPLVAVETFVDPHLFQGSCYRASGWQCLGETAGYGRSRKDFYQAHERPKELWFKILDRRGFRRLKSKRLPQRLTPHETEWRVCPFKATSLDSLFTLLSHVPEHRAAKGRRYRRECLLSLIALATLCGFSGHRAVASFGAELDQKQRRRLRCWRHRKTGTYVSPGETCIRNFLNELDVESLENVVAQWMEGLDPTELSCIAIDGKTLKGTAQRNEAGEKKGALHLVSAAGHNQSRFLAQEAAADKSNEIPAARKLLERFAHLDGITITTDAMDCLDETARLIVQQKGGLTTFV